jgi:hypothetical protein
MSLYQALDLGRYFLPWSWSLMDEIRRSHQNIDIIVGGFVRRCINEMIVEKLVGSISQILCFGIKEE